MTNEKCCDQQHSLGGSEGAAQARDACKALQHQLVPQGERHVCCLRGWESNHFPHCSLRHNICELAWGAACLCAATGHNGGRRNRSESVDGPTVTWIAMQAETVAASRSSGSFLCEKAAPSTSNAARASQICLLAKCIGISVCD